MKVEVRGKDVGKESDSLHTEADRELGNILSNSPFADAATKDRVTFQGGQASYPGLLGLYVAPFLLCPYGKDVNFPDIHSSPFTFGKRIL